MEDTEVLTAVRAAWADILDVPADSLSDTSEFFAEGGDSLLAVEVSVRLSDELGVEAPLESLLLDGTFAGFCEATLATVQNDRG